MGSGWQRGDVIGLAHGRCPWCHGLGLRRHSRGVRPCKCALKKIFRICLAKYHELRREAWKYRLGRRWWRNIDYLADFFLLCRRQLDGWERRLFQMYFLEGQPWYACAGKLGVDRGNFFHAVYRIEAKLGRALRETEPYPLYPLSDYFAGSRRWAKGGRG